MMSRFVCRILKFQLPMWNLCAAAIGCFAFMRGFRLVALEREESDAASSTPYRRQLVWGRLAQSLMRSYVRASIRWTKPAPLMFTVESDETDSAKRVLSA
jgi:hypothetical protein